MKHFALFSTLALLASSFSFSNVKQTNKEISWGGLKATPVAYERDYALEPEAKNAFDYNFAYMGLGGTSLDSASIWDYQRGETSEGKPVTVAIIDSGIDIYHEDFLSPSAKGKAINSTNVASYSIIDPKSCYIYDTSDGYYTSKVKTEVGILNAYDEGDLEDDGSYYSHGTATASCVAANINGSGGFGIAPKANLLIIKMDFYLTSLDVAIRYAADNGASVINMSLGAYATNFTDGFGDKQEGDASVATSLVSALNYAYSKDVVVVAAAGNEKTSVSSYPASNSGVIGVGALEEKSGTSLSYYSNFNKTGSTSKGNNNVDVVASGTVYTANVPSTNRPSRGDGGTSIADSTYFTTNGTSFASPLTAGAIALYRGKYPSKTRTQVMDALYSSCSDIGSSGWDNKFGYGRVNVASFLDDGIPVEEVSITPSESRLKVGESITLTASFSPIDASEEYKQGLWISENEEVATIDENTGLVSAISVGTARVGFLTEEGLEAYATIIVEDDGIKLTSISLESYPKTTFFKGELDKSKVVLRGTYEDNSTRLLSGASIILNGDTSTIGYKKVDVSFGGFTTSFNTFVTNKDAPREEITTIGEEATYSRSSGAYFKSSGETLTLSNGDKSKTIDITLDTDTTYFGYFNNENTSQIGSNKQPATYVKLTIKNYVGTINKIAIGTRFNTNSTLSIKVGNVDFSSNGSTSIKGSNTLNTYEFNGSSSGDIVISYAVGSKAVYFDDIAITTAGNVSYSWSEKEQASSFISYLKTFVGSCAVNFVSRDEVKNLINEYNYLLKGAKEDPMFNETFNDNGYEVNAMEKLKMMVSQYNSSLQEGESSLSLSLPNETIFAGNSLTGNIPSINSNNILLIIVIGLSSVAIASFLIVYYKKKTTK